MKQVVLVLQLICVLYFNYLLNDLWIRTFLFLYCLKCKLDDVVIFLRMFVFFPLVLFLIKTCLFSFPSSRNLEFRKSTL